VSDGVRRPLSVLVVEPPASRAIIRALEDSPRTTVASTSQKAAVQNARRTAPDLVLVPDAASSRPVRRRLRLAGFRTAGLSDIPPSVPDPIAVLASLAARPGAGLRHGPPVSVVATVLQERATVEVLVDRIGEQLGPQDEFLVLDGGSTDGTYERVLQLAATRPWLRALQQPGTNISAGRNAAIAQARNDVLATTDAGCTPAPHWLDGLRMPFAEAAPPGLVAGVPRVAAKSALQRAQAHACYPDPDELVRPHAWVRAYTRVLGLGFDPRVPFARSLAFTKEAWQLAGGFPEELGWVEDGVFGRAVAEHLPCVATRHATVTWDQRPSLRGTFTMYKRYGIGAAESGDRSLAGHDLARAAAYLAGGAVLFGGRRRAVPGLVAGGLVYASLPLARAVRHRAGPGAIALVPLAMATKDWGKLTGLVSVTVAGRRR
jgi:hypothetical protein